MRTVNVYHEFPPAQQIFEIYKEEEQAVFLDSSLTNSLGRYSMIGLYPYLTLEQGKEFKVNGQVKTCSFEVYLNQYLSGHQDQNETDLPIVSGAIGYFSYEYGRKKEGVSTRHQEGIPIPDVILNFYDVFIIEDHHLGKLYIVANNHGLASTIRVKEIETQIFHHKITQQGQKTSAKDIILRANFLKNDYLDTIKKMVNYIIEGDIYIANMTQELQIESEVKPYELFLTLRKKNPSPFGGYFNYHGFNIVSASPERFLKMKNRHIATRPIKGTRRRGNTPEEDRELRLELEQSEKDKSELLMIVDLERNDLNKVCQPGSVKVTELFQVEEYATVFHLVANIEGKLADELTVMDLIEATFPGGSITGAPKLRAMDVIDELEHGRRNLYTGSLGYLTLDGACDFNIIIRTVLYREGVYYLGVGGGITCESDYEFEYEETLQKAQAIIDALKS